MKFKMKEEKKWIRKNWIKNEGEIIKIMLNKFIIIFLKY